MVRGNEQHLLNASSVIDQPTGAKEESRVLLETNARHGVADRGEIGKLRGIGAGIFLVALVKATTGGLLPRQGLRNARSIHHDADFPEAKCRGNPLDWVAHFQVCERVRNRQRPEAAALGDVVRSVGALCLSVERIEEQLCSCREGEVSKVKANALRSGTLQRQVPPNGSIVVETGDASGKVRRS